MLRFLLRVAVNLAGSALALLIASWLVQGVHLQPAGFLAAVAVFTVAQSILSPFVDKMARKYAAPMLGGIGLVSTLLALWIATLFPGGLRIQGASAWIVSALCVWLVTALAGWILPILVIDRRWGNPQGAK